MTNLEIKRIECLCKLLNFNNINIKNAQLKTEVDLLFPLM